MDKKFVIAFITPIVLAAVFVWGFAIGRANGIQYTLDNQEIGGQNGEYYACIDDDERYYYNMKFDPTPTLEEYIAWHELDIEIIKAD